MNEVKNDPMAINCLLPSNAISVLFQLTFGPIGDLLLRFCQLRDVVFCKCAI